MRHINNNTKADKKNKRHTSSSSFASKALIATATATTSFVAYYCASALLLSSSVAASSSSADGGVDSERTSFNIEKKKGDYGIEYSHFDTYPGIHLDDGTGVATKEVKDASMQVVFDALDAAGLDELAIVKGKPMNGDGDDVTLHPKHAHRKGLGTCPVYGCPYLPLDVHYDEVVKKQLENMRNIEDTSAQHDESWIINSSGSDNAAVLTLIGYKGGALDAQINQDRAIMLSPYLYYNINSSNGEKSSGTVVAATRPIVRLIGAFDGHAKFGEKVSEYVVKTLPALLGKKLVEYEAKHAKDEVVDQPERDDDISHILHETFLELDATSPAIPSGGCTASLVFQLGEII